MELVRRLVVAAIAIPMIVALVLWATPFLFFLVLAGFVVLAQYEFYRLFPGISFDSGVWLGLTAGAGFLYVIYLKSTGSVPPETLEVVAALLLLTVMGGTLLSGGVSRMGQLPVVWLGVMYIPFLLGTILLIRGVPGGARWILYLLALTWIVDSGAYFVGKMLGRHKMAPAISPGKTWEGAIGGAVAGVLFSVLVISWLPAPLSRGTIFWISLLLSVTGQLGDLVESGFKRQAGVKDSGHLLPGHGGMLDKVDSLIFNAPVLYGVLIFYEGLSSPVIV
ncbi:MAG: phosphatidate cytidylyltransferase [Nitrospiraceae bacterium]|jgi:phosphatidate cytidylyltransferase|nr:phosphatidate cytidylyltransferase [Nitrospiraceae bacterium]